MSDIGPEVAEVLAGGASRAIPWWIVVDASTFATRIAKMSESELGTLLAEVKGIVGQLGVIANDTAKAGGERASARHQLAALLGKQGRLKAALNAHHTRTFDAKRADVEALLDLAESEPHSPAEGFIIDALRRMWDMD